MLMIYKTLSGISPEWGSLMLRGEIFLLLQKSSPFGRAVAFRRLRGFCLLFLKNDPLAEHIVQHDDDHIREHLDGKPPQALGCT